jgi:hypothetical protein
MTRARIGSGSSRTVAATFLWRRRRRRIEPAWGGFAMKVRTSSPTVIDKSCACAGNVAHGHHGSSLSWHWFSTDSFTTTESLTMHKSAVKVAAENDSSSATPEPPLGIFRLLNDSERQLLTMQRQLTDDAVRCFGRERESAYPLWFLSAIRLVIHVSLIYGMFSLSLCREAWRARWVFRRNPTKDGRVWYSRAPTTMPPNRRQRHCCFVLCERPFVSWWRANTMPANQRSLMRCSDKPSWKLDRCPRRMLCMSWDITIIRQMIQT